MRRIPKILTVPKVLMVLLVSALMAPGCASTGGGGDLPPFAQLTIENDNPRIVTVYAVRGGTRSRLGTVTGLTSETFELRRHMLDGVGRLQVLVEPLGSSNRYYSDPIPVSEGDELELSVSALVR